MKQNGVDARPWLIISRREARALYRALVMRLDDQSELGRAVRQLGTQLDWLEQHRNSSVSEAIEREYRQS